MLIKGLAIFVLLEEIEVLEGNKLTCYLKELIPAKEGLRKVKVLEIGMLRIIEAEFFKKAINSLELKEM